MSACAFDKTASVLQKHMRLWNAAICVAQGWKALRLKLVKNGFMTLKSRRLACHARLQVVHLQLQVHLLVLGRWYSSFVCALGSSRNLSTVPNQGCCSQVFEDNVGASRQLLDRMSARELQSLFADLSQRLNVPVSGQFVPERLGAITA